MILSVTDPAAAAEDPALAEAPVYLNTLEVTANKRPQRLGEVDGSVSVRTGEDLREAGVTKTQELERVFPGLVIRKRGNRAYTSFSLRGLSSPDFYNPAVQVYVDGVPQDPAYLTQELLDVERVEVLRGPQGTLYGRNAHGGVINVITRRPGNEFRGRVEGSYSTHDWSAGGGLSGALVEDQIFGSLDIRRADFTGQIDDIATGEDDIDDSRTWIGRAKLLITPKELPLEIALTAQRDELESREELYILDSNLDDLNYNSATQGGVNQIRRDVNSYAVSLSYDFDDATLTSVTSYQDRDIDQRLIQGFDTPEFQETLAEELRLDFALDERWSGVAGVFFQDANFTRETPALLPFLGASENQVDTETYALFGEVTYALTDSVDVTGGLRWSREDASIDYERQAPAPITISDDDSFTELSPKASVGWSFAENQRLYALASRGFKPGGFNHTVAFTESDPNVEVAYESETSTNLELGWRGTLFDGKLEAGVAGYWIFTKDKQIFVGPIGAQYLRNAGDAQSYGLEIDARVYPTDDLTLDFGATVGRSVFTDAQDPITGVDYDGNRLPNAPDYSLKAALRYYIPQNLLPGEVSFRLAGSYTGRTYFDEANSLSQPGYFLLDSSLDLELDNGAAVSLFVNNATNKIYRTYSFEQGGSVSSSVGDARVIGLAASFSF